MYGAVRGLVTIPGLLGILAFFSREVPECIRWSEGSEGEGWVYSAIVCVPGCCCCASVLLNQNSSGNNNRLWFMAGGAGRY